ncbi:MAG: helicase-related protein [bacterium]|nr:helicase-related protein [bacterium]
MTYDFTYHPVVADAAEVLRAAAADRFLLVGRPLTDGEGLPEGFEEVPACRHLTPEATGVVLPVGNYRFQSAEGVAVMLVTDGAAPIGPQRGSLTSGDDSFGDDPSGADPPRSGAFGAGAFAWFRHYWDSADLLPRPRFALHDDVVTVPDGRETTVRSRSFVGADWRYRVRLDGAQQWVWEGGIAHAEFDDGPEGWVSRPPGDVRQVAATLTRAKLGENLTDTVYSFGATRTVFRAYQFIPVMKMLQTAGHSLTARRGKTSTPGANRESRRSAVRPFADRSATLIADEVGLGKTIEAGLVWTELDARGAADRVLVVCPSGLVDKWRDEMRRRFGYETEELDGSRLNELLERLERDAVPARWRGVCSLERLRAWPGLERIGALAPRFDLIVVDEAHSLRNLGTRSHALGALLSEWAATLLFLSATPLNLGNRDLFNLLNLLDAGDFDDPHTLERRLEPNAVLHRVSVLLADPDAAPEGLVRILRSIHGLLFGPSITNRPEFERLEDLLARAPLEPSERAEAKRLIAELNSLASIVTRTRKADVTEDNTVREPWTEDVDLAAAERRLYDAVYRWQVRRADALKMPVGFVGQMPLRLAGSCLQATRLQVLGWGGGTSSELWTDEDGAFDDPDDDLSPPAVPGPGTDAAGDAGDSAGDDSWESPPGDVVAAARALGDVDTKFDRFVTALDAIVRQGRKVLVFTFSRATLAYLLQRLETDRRFRVCELHGGVPQADRPGLLQRFRDGHDDVMLATRVAGEGLDFEFCSAVVNYDLPWNPMEVEQRIGRIDRFGQAEDKILILNFHTPGTIESDIIARVHQRIGVFETSIGELEPILRSELPGIRRTMFDFSLTPEQRLAAIDRTLVARGIKAGIAQQVEDAAESLNVLDRAEVDGFENEVRLSGRYVGQPELAWLLEDWAASAPGAVCRRSAEGPWLHLTGNAEMARNLLGLSNDRELSYAEVAAYHTRLRNEDEITLCLDQETARRQGADLLGANHPLVRAAVRIPRASQRAFGAARVASTEIPPGWYLVLVAVARWNGVRPAAELWTAAVTAAAGAAHELPGTVLLANLAEAALQPASGVGPKWMTRHVRACDDLLALKHRTEQDRRTAENRRLVEARLAGLAETHERRLAGIRQRIDTLRARNRPDTISLHEAQLNNQQHRYEEGRLQIEQARAGALHLQEIALCSLEVVQ